MSLDITLFTGQDIQPWVADEIEYSTNPRNAFKYKIKFLYHIYNDESNYMSAFFRVKREVEQSTSWVSDITYVIESRADDYTYVDNLGNIVPEKIEDSENPGQYITNPDAWGTEFNRMRVLFAAPIEDSLIVEEYQQILFDRGIFDFPRNRNI